MRYRADYNRTYRLLGFVFEIKEITFNTGETRRVLKDTVKNVMLTLKDVLAVHSQPKIILVDKLNT